MASLAGETMETPETHQPFTEKINGIIDDWIQDNYTIRGEYKYYKYLNEFMKLKQGSGSLFKINDENQILTVIGEFYQTGIPDIKFLEFLEEFDAFLEYMYSVDKEIINYEGYWKLKIIIESFFPLDYESEKEDEGDDDHPMQEEEDKEIFAFIRTVLLPGEFKKQFNEFKIQFDESDRDLIEYFNERMRIAKEIDDWYSLCDGDVAVIGVNKDGAATIEFLTKLKPELGDVETPPTPSGQLKRTSTMETPGTLQRRQTIVAQSKRMQQNDAQFVQLIKNTAEYELNNSVDVYCNEKNMKKEECNRIKKYYGKAFDENKKKINVNEFIEEDKKFIELQKTLFEIGDNEKLSGIHRKKTMESLKKKFEKRYESGSESDEPLPVNSPPRLRRYSNLGIAASSSDSGMEDTETGTQPMDIADDDIEMTSDDERIFQSLEADENYWRDYYGTPDSVLVQVLEEFEKQQKNGSSGGTRKNKKKKRRTKKYKRKKGTKKNRRRKKKTRDKR